MTIEERLIELQKTCGDLTDRLDGEKLLNSRLSEAVERYSMMVRDYETTLKSIAENARAAITVSSQDIWTDSNYHFALSVLEKNAEFILKNWKNR